MASSSRGGRPNLLRQESTEIIASPPPPPSANYQPTPEELAEINIRVLDYAYMDTGLPPVPHYGLSLRAPRQVVVGPKPIEHPRNGGDEDMNDPFSAGLRHQASGGSSQPVASTSGSGGSSSQKAKPLEREDTEPTPAESSQRPIPGRAQGYSDLAFYQPSLQSQSQSQSQLQSQSQQSSTSRQPPRPPHIITNSQQQSQSAWNHELSSPSQQVPQFAHSQESEYEPYIDTPLITPNGSLQWAAPEVDISAIPESQMDTDSQMPPPDIFSYSQMGFDPLESQSQTDHLSSPSPAREPSQHHHLQLSPPPAIASPHFAILSPGNSSGPFAGPSSSLPPSSPVRQSRSRSPRRRPSTSKSEPESPSAPRYNLRKRQASSPIRSQPPPAPAQRMTRSRSRQPQAPPQRRPPFTMQASHSQDKSRVSHSKTNRVRRPRRIAAANARGREERMISG